MPDTNDPVAKLLENALDIREWLARLDTKIDGMAGNLTEIKRDVAEAKSKGDSAQRTADEAMALARQAKEETDEMKKNTKWLWTTLISAAAVVAAIFIAILQ